MTYTSSRQYESREVRGKNNPHSVVVGYIAWMFGFMGVHRFYYGKQITGVIWFFTCGLFFIGWIVDFFLIPSMNSEADFNYQEGRTDYSLAWILLAFLGIFGVHRMYMGKWLTGIAYALTLGLFGFGLLYDYLTLNSQIDEINRYEHHRYSY